MITSDTIKDKLFGLTGRNVESVTFLKRSMGYEYNVFQVSEDWFSLRALMELAKLAVYTNAAQQIVLEDSATNRCRKMIQFVGFVVSCKGTLILSDLDSSAYRRQFLTDILQ